MTGNRYNHYSFWRHDLKFSALFLIALLNVNSWAAVGEMIDDTGAKLGARLVLLNEKTPVSVHGTIVAIPSAPPGVGYAILNERQELTHYVMEAADLNLSAFNGKSVTATGTVFAKDDKYNTPVFVCNSISDGVATKTSSINANVVPIGETVNLSIKTPKTAGDSLVASSEHMLVSDVGTLYKADGPMTGVERMKYVLKNNGAILRYIVEPDDVDLAPMLGRTISLSGYSLGRNSKDNVSVIQMRNASTFG
jgi:hypothetical protein